MRIRSRRDQMGLDGRFDAAHMFPTMRAVTLLLAVAGLAHGRATRAGEVPGTHS